MVVAVMMPMMVVAMVLGLRGGSQHAKGQAGDKEVSDLHDKTVE